MSDTDRLPPHSQDAEQAVLGSLLIDPAAIFEISSFLKPEAFYHPANRLVYDAIVTLTDARDPVDLVTLANTLRQREQLEEVGGEPYLIDLLNAVPTSVNIESYARLVEKSSVRRRLIRAAGKIANLAWDEAEDVEVVLDKSEEALFGISEERTTRDLTPVKYIARELLERMEELRARQDEIIGIPTGFVDLDRMLGGLNKSDLVILAARPGMGKTALLLAFALNAARKHNKRVAMFNLEMSGEQLLMRMIATETNIDSQRLRRGKIYDTELGLFYEAVGRLSEAPIYIDDTANLTPRQLRNKCRRLYAEKGIDLVCIDYLQLMGADRNTNNRVQEISDISRGLKLLARELNVPVIAAAQLSRSVESRQDKRPILSDLRDSGCLTGDSLVTLAETNERVPIRELVGKNHFCVWAVNETTWKLEAMPVSNAFCTGVKPVYRLVTQLGRTIRATGNHQFLSFANGWQRLDQLAVDDYLALPRIIPDVAAEPTLSNDQLGLLGHLIGDGCVLPRHAIQYTTREADLAEYVSDLASNVFGDRLKPRINPERTWYQVYLSASQHLTHGVTNPVTEWFRELGIMGLRSHEKFVPDVVFMQPAASIAHFLRHLWATDGCVRMRKTGERQYPAIYYATSSVRLAQDVQTLLLRVGINARQKIVSQKDKGRDQHHVIVSGHEDMTRFVEIVGAVGRYKQSSLAEVKTHLANTSANTNRDVIPNSAWRDLVVPSMQVERITTRQMQASIGQTYCGTSLYSRNMSRERAGRVANAVRSEPLQALAQSDVYWDKIVSIELDGEEEVYDLTVPIHHNFVANDLIVHNSIEQDADIVSFIYRDEYYNPDSTDRPGIAELNVAKHRNGPTGTVDLFWQGELATFRNLQRQEVQL